MAPPRTKHTTTLLLQIAFAIAAAFFALTSPAHAGKRVALVIGNGAYVNKTPLPNAVNDARAVSRAFADLKYELVGDPTGNTNLDRTQMTTLLDRFRDQSAGAEAAIVYYAGHGFEKFLIPVSAKLERETDLDFEAIPFRTVLAALSRARIGIAIVDACRSTDFPLTGRDGVRRGPGAQRGLARISPNEKVYVAYSAKERQSAFDGPRGGLSPYAKAFLVELRKPNQNINATFGNVQEAVAKLNRPDASDEQRQDPIAVNGLGNANNEQEFSFNPTSVSAPRGTTSADQETAFWNSLGTNPTRQRLESFLQQFPNGRFAPQARSRLQELNRPGRRFRDCAECPEMIVVPGRRPFKMGSDKNDAGRLENEGPPQPIVIGVDFAVGLTEVTFAQWDACVRASGCNSYVPPDRGWGRAEMPVINVSWEDAQAYLTWLSYTRTDRKYRLLSEAQWEYAARAGSTDAYPWGPSITAANARFNANAPSPVGRFARNSFGLFDMNGNVWEWVEDCYLPTLTGYPADGRSRSVPNCSLRSLRGGGWNTAGPSPRTALRLGSPPRQRTPLIGFRVAADLTGDH